jgi:DNA polymerase-4
VARAIIHLNVADFAVAVEQVIDARLRGRPAIIAPQGALRAGVYDMSEEAYRCGVRKGMALGRAVAFCRDAHVLAPHPDRYERAMRELLKRALPYSPRIEVNAADGHLFMDVTGTGRLFGTPEDVAWRVRREIKADLGLNPIWAIATNKLVAKVASRLVKPFGEYQVSPGGEEALLAPLSLGLLPGVEPADLRRLRDFNLTRVRQLTALSLAQLQGPFGARARFLYETARGIDTAPVLPAGTQPPAARAGHEFGPGADAPRVLEGTLYALAERVGGDLRRRRVVARRLAVVLDYADGVRCARRSAAAPPTANDLTLFEQARGILVNAWKRRVRIRHLELIGDRLCFPPVQLELFAAERQAHVRRAGLVAAIDAIRSRFGPDAIHMGRTLAA